MKTSVGTNNILSVDSWRYLTGMLGIITLACAFLVLLAPKEAEARADYLTSITSQHTASNERNLCGNCHADWSGGGEANINRLGFNLWAYTYGTNKGATIPATNPYYAMDDDNDGLSVDGEYDNSVLTARPVQCTAPNCTTGTPNPALNWFPSYPDVDGDGCIMLFSRYTEAGYFKTPGSIMSSGTVGGGDNFSRYVPVGWDVDDNDSTKGCSAVWSTTAGPAASPGTTTDTWWPGQVTDFTASRLAASSIPLKWSQVPDDAVGSGGPQTAVKAHDYDMRYTLGTNAVLPLLCAATGTTPTGTTQCSVRNPLHWVQMYNMNVTEQVKDASFNTGSAVAPLVRVMYEPRPVAATGLQPCNALGNTASCIAGDSFVLSVKGNTNPGGLTTNTIADGQTYWLGMWVSDGVVIPSGTVTAPGTFTEHATLSNIVAVTAGTGGAAITSISPTTISTEQSAVSVTVNGFGLIAANASQMVLTNAAGGTVLSATGVTPGTTTVSGNFNTVGLAPGKYNLELRPASPSTVTKAAWVEAINATAAAPILTSISPNTFGQGAVNKIIQFIGSNMNGGSATFSGTGITPNPVPLTGTASPWTATISASSTATSGNVTVTVSGNTTAPVAYTVTAAPSHNCAPPGGTVGVLYSYSCTASGTVPGNYTWDVTGLPAGLSWAAGGTNNATLTISGTPTTANAPAGSSGAIRVTDSNSGSVINPITIVIAKGSQTITLTCPASIPGGTSGTCTATSSAGLTVSLVSNTTTVCTVSGSAPSYTVTGAAVTVNSTCTVTASQGGDANYNAATSVPRNITITAVNGVTHSCAPALPGATYGVAYSYSCTASGAGTNPYVWTVSGLPAAGLTHSTGGTNNNTLTISGTPTSATNLSFTIAVRDSAATPATFGPTNHTLAIAKANQTITLNCSPLTILIGGTSSCSATASSGLPVSLATTTPAVCSVGGTATPYTVNGLQQGNCSVTASQTGNANYNAATPVPQNITVNKLDQTITLTCSPLSVLIGGTSSCTATSDSGLPVSLVSQTGTVCSVTGTASPYTVRGDAVGTCTVAANQAGNATYNAAAPRTQNITVADAKPDLIMDTVTKTAASVHVGAGFAVDNVVRNQGAVLAGTSYVKFYLSVDPTVTTSDIVLTGSRYVPGLAAGAVSASASTTVTVPKGVSPGTYYVGACADANSQVAETNETNNCLAATGTTPVTINVIRQVDLVIVPPGPTTPVTSVSVGATMPVSATVRNDGPTNMTAASSFAKFYLSVDNVITASDIALSPSGFVPSLASGASHTVSITVTAPKGMSPGTYYLGVCADATSVQVETSETNNCLASAGTITVTRNVDLIMTAVSTTATTASVAATIPVESTVRNQGTTGMTVASSFVKYYLSLDTTIIASDIAMSPTRFVAALGAGVDSTGTTTVTVPKTMNPGVYYLGACADSTNAQPETNEGNNCLPSTATITITRSVDLVMDSVSKTATTVGAGETFPVDIAVRNQGTTPMTSPSSFVKFYLSADAVCTTSDIVMTPSRFVPALPAGGVSSTTSTMVTVPKSVAPAAYTVCACADASNQQPETNETNNCMAATPATINVIRQVDLVMTAVSTVSTSVAVGGSFSIDSTEQNQGTTIMTAASNVIKFYLSTDATITSSDKLLSGLRFVTPSLAAGASSTGSTTVTVPNTVLPGTYYIGAIADANNGQPEINELNNALAGMTINVTP